MPQDNKPQANKAQETTPELQGAPTQTEAEWWAEDAARINALSQAAIESGAQYGNVHQPPALNADGSLAE